MSLTLEPDKLWGLRFTDTFLQLFCEKNSDGTKKLRLKGNELRQRFQDNLLPADMVHVCNFLRTHPEINELDVSYNPIEDEGLETLCHITLKHPNSLEHVNVANCDIGVFAIKTLYFIAEEGFTRLKTLRLTGNKIGTQGGHMISMMLSNIPSLEYLDLGNTDQTADSVEELFLQVNPSSLKILNVSRVIPPTSLTQVNHTFLADSISELVRINESLVELHLQKCDLDAHCLQTVIEGLRFNNTLRFLDVGYNNICCFGAEFLAEWLKTRPEILGLNIAGNKVKNHGGVALSFGLPFSKVRYLDISYNQIGNEGIIAILNSIKKPYMLRYFLLWGNNFSHPANKIIERMMRSKVFEQERIDVQIYCVDGVLHAARYPVDKYKHRYYGVTDYGCAEELKIKRNSVEMADDEPRALVNFKHIDRYPPVEIPGTIQKSDSE